MSDTTGIQNAIESCRSEGWNKTANAAQGEYILVIDAIKKAQVLESLLEAYQGAADDFNIDYPLIRRCKKALKALAEAKGILP